MALAAGQGGTGGNVTLAGGDSIVAASESGSCHNNGRSGVR